MPDLSACYFCGTALDEPLSEYPVVPRTLQPGPDQQRTVVLCPSCRRKLGRVVDAVVDAVDDRSIDGTIQQGLSASDGARSASRSIPGEDPGEPSDSVTDDADASEPPVEAWTTPERTGESEAADDSGGDGAATADAAAADRTDATDASTETAFDATPPPDAASDEGPSGSATDDPSGSATDDPSESGADGSTASTEGAKPTDGDGDEDEPNLTALEYTKVMRLLENRELPVEREALRVVATNAYEIRPREFDAIVDVAIERGLLVEEDGQFVAIE